MNRFVFAAVLLLAAPATAQIISPDDGRADEMIRNKCENDWPIDFEMRLYCIRKQQAAAWKLRDIQSDPQPIIEKTEPIAIFDQGPFKPARWHDGYNRPLGRDGEPIR